MAISTDRQSNGEQWTIEQVTNEVYKSFQDWRGIRTVATIMAESGGWTWIRPMVISPTSPAHLSTDRGICQWNSYWWTSVPDSVAFDPVAAIARMCDEVTTDTWEIDLDPWHGSKSDNFYAFLPAARAAINVLREDAGLKPV